MCARRSSLRARRCAARRQRSCVRRPDTSPRPPQVLREQEGVRGYTELQSKHRATYGDDEEAREAAGKAALLRAKESLSTGWAARLGCEQRGRLAAAVQRQLRGVRQRVQTVVSAQECARERATRKRSRFQSASVCVCGHRGVCSRPRTNATVIGQSLLASPDQRRNSWCVCSRHVDQRIFWVRMRVGHQRAAQSAPGPGPGRVCLKQERRVKRHGGGRRVFMSGMRY